MPRKSRHDAALDFRKQHNGYRPEALRDSPQRRRRKSFAKYNPENFSGLLYRLAQVLGNPRLYVLQAAYLGLPESAALPDKIYCPRTLDLWKNAVKLGVKSPFFGQFELDRRGVLHCHIIAEANVLSELEGIKQIGVAGHIILQNRMMPAPMQTNPPPPNSRRRAHFLKRSETPNENASDFLAVHFGGESQGVDYFIFICCLSQRTHVHSESKPTFYRKIPRNFAENESDL
jgi:hypothetical protein